MIGISLLSFALLALLPPVQFLEPKPAAGTPVEYYVAGQPQSPVKIEVFSDYQCPACRTFYLDTIRNVLTSYANEPRVSVVYHDYPLPAHKYSREATRYALAARKMGREYWLRLTDALYSDQEQWSQNGRIDLIAEKISLPQEYARLKRFLKDPSILLELQRELDVVRARKVESTPTLFIVINGREQKLVGGIPYPSLKSQIDRLLRPTP